MIRPLRAIVLEARIDATPTAVWHALTDGDGLADWFAPFAKAQQGAGAIVEVSWDATSFWPTTIEVWEPERHLRWADPAPSTQDGPPQPRLLTDWFISTEAGQTVLRLVHSGFGEGANWDDQIDGLQGGWKYFMWNLELYLTRHRGTRRTMISARRRVEGARGAFWDSLFTSGFVTMDRAATLPQPATLTFGAENFDAVVQTLDDGVRLAARVTSLEDALLFIEVEGKAEAGFFVGFWLSTYGLPPSRIEDVRRSFDETVARLTEPAAATL